MKWFLIHKVSSGLLIGACLVSCSRSPEAPGMLELWYRQPASEWTDALPIGNGRMGAMIFGGVSRDRIQFNEETFWTGGPEDANRPDAYRYLPEIRKLLFEGRQKEAEALAGAHFMGRKFHESDYDHLYARWLRKVRDPRALAPAAPGYDDRAWPRMKVPTPDGFERVIPSLEGENGAFWFRQTFVLPDSWKSRAPELLLGNIRDGDFTYVNGHFAGSSQGMGTVRRYRLQASWLHPGKNTIAIQVINPDNKGGLAGNMHTHAPMGIRDGSLFFPLDSTWRYDVQDDSPPPFPHYQAAYQPLGDLWLDFPGLDSISGYRRSLDLDRAVSQTTFISKGVRYTRSYFASEPRNVIVIRLESDRSGAVSFRARLTAKHRLAGVRKLDDSTIALDLRLKTGVLHAESRLRVLAAKGSVEIDTAGMITVRHADRATLYLSAATSFVNDHDVSGDPGALCGAALASLEGTSPDSVEAAHVRAYRHYFGDFSIDFGHTASEKLPTNERIARFDTAADPSLVALYVQYARYLLLASSWPSSKEPPNLQGVWNDQMRPPWDSKFTTNVNLEMNYWPAEALGLSATEEPLFSMLRELSVTGHRTASDYYGCPGWVLHHNTDLWRRAAPIDNPDHGIWVTGGAWLCHALWRHYCYSLDPVFLRDTAYPVMRSAAEFFTCFLIPDPRTGYLISTPSNSPEHGGLVAGPAMDQEIIRDLFRNCIRAAEILHTDTAFRDALARKLSRIAPSRIGRYGQLQEWLEDRDDTSDHHRHVSHLWAVFPGGEITPDSTPRLMAAARKSLLYRGDEGTGWSLAWKINLWDRFGEGDHAYRLLKTMLSPAEAPGRRSRGGVYRNLFDAHPPYQIDGNFGGAAGIAAMLLENRHGEILLLPALPRALATGTVRGLCAEGGFQVDLGWKDGRLTGASIVSGAGGACRLRYHGKQVSFPTEKGSRYRLNGQLELQPR